MNLSEVKEKCTNVSIGTINLGNEYSLTQEVKWLIEQAEKTEKIKILVEDENLTKGESFDKISKVLGF